MVLLLSVDIHPSHLDKKMVWLALCWLVPEGGSVPSMACPVAIFGFATL